MVSLRQPIRRKRQPRCGQTIPHGKRSRLGNLSVENDNPGVGKQSLMEKGLAKATYLSKMTNPYVKHGWTSFERGRNTNSTVCLTALAE